MYVPFVVFLPQCEHDDGLQSSCTSIGGCLNTFTYQLCTHNNVRCNDNKTAATSVISSRRGSAFCLQQRYSALLFCPLKVTSFPSPSSFFESPRITSYLPPPPLGPEALYRLGATTQADIDTASSMNLSVNDILRRPKLWFGMPFPWDGRASISNFSFLDIVFFCWHNRL